MALLIDPSLTPKLAALKIALLRAVEIEIRLYGKQRRIETFVSRYDSPTRRKKYTHKLGVPINRPIYKTHGNPKNNSAGHGFWDEDNPWFENVVRAIEDYIPS